MNEIAEERRAYAQSGPWDRLGGMLRITLAVLFLLITVVFFAIAQDGLISASDAVPAQPAPTAPAATAPAVSK